MRADAPTSRLRQARGVVVGGVGTDGGEFRAQAGDDAVARVAGVLAEAFLTDPHTVFLLPRSRRRERLADMFDRVIGGTLRPRRGPGPREASPARRTAGRRRRLPRILHARQRAPVRAAQVPRDRPRAWPPRAYPRPGSDIMDLGSC